MRSDFRSKDWPAWTIFLPARSPPKRVPGAVVAIARDGKLVQYKAYGQLDPTKGTPMPLDAVFALASMTKPMAAVAGLTLMEQGRLPLQAKLADYYPAFAEMKVGVPQADGSLKLEAQASPIHIHDLYRHTSGLMYGGRPDSSSPVARQYPDGTAPAIEGDTQAFIDRITKLPLAHQPSTVFEYGFSIDVLGAVVEKVSEQRLGEYLAGNVWQPLGMKDATFHPTEAQRARLARPFPNDPLTGKPQAIKLLDTPTKSDCGGACAFATVGDYVRFGQMLLNGGELDGQRILGPKTVHHMISNHLGPEIKNNVANVEPHRGGFGFGLGGRRAHQRGPVLGSGQSRRVHLEWRLRHAVLLRPEGASCRRRGNGGARRTSEVLSRAGPGHRLRRHGEVGRCIRRA